MKQKCILFSLSFCLFFFSCNKEKENPQEPVPSPVEIKYLHKVYFGGKLWEEYTWDTQKRLIRVDLFNYQDKYELIYGTDKNLDSIYYSSPLGKYAGKFYYNESRQVSKMEFKHYYNSNNESQRLNNVEYAYAGNKLSSVNLSFGQKKQEPSVIFDWGGNNLLRLKDNLYGAISIFNAYDTMKNPYQLIPQIILLNILGDAYFAPYLFTIASENNNILSSYNGVIYEYKYDYDADGYPISSYVKQNGEWVKEMQYEYLSN